MTNSKSTCTNVNARVLTNEPLSITARAILPQPPHKTAIISGFNYVSRIFALLGEIVVRIRVDKR